LQVGLVAGHCPASETDPDDDPLLDDDEPLDDEPLDVDDPLDVVEDPLDEDVLEELDELEPDVELEPDEDVVPEPLVLPLAPDEPLLVRAPLEELPVVELVEDPEPLLLPPSDAVLTVELSLPTQAEPDALAATASMTRPKEIPWSGFARCMIAGHYAHPPKNGRACAAVGGRGHEFCDSWNVGPRS
jgi:hypothetical protein